STAWSDGRSGRDVRRIRAWARARTRGPTSEHALSTVWSLARAIGLWKCLGLLLAGAVLHGPLAAQRDTIPKARRDSIARRDSLARLDSLRRDSLAKQDTLIMRRDTTIRIRVPTRADSLLQDTLAKKDSLHPPKP